jgi:hypothetical protein
VTSPEPDNPEAWVEALLRAAGWETGSPQGGGRVPHVVREFRPGTDKVVLDFALFIGDRLVGAVEVSARMSDAVAHQARRLQEALFALGQFSHDALPVIYFSNGREIALLAGPDDEVRQVAAFHSPATLDDPHKLRGLAHEVAELPRELPPELRDFQAEALRRLELSLASGDRRALIALASGSGRTALAVTEVDRLLRHTSATRVLFVVDRQAVADQLLAALRAYRSNDRSFGGDFVIETASGRGVSAAANVVVMTVQRLLVLMQHGGEARTIPVDFFDFVFVFDPERLTGGSWEGALDYFDAPLVGLTNTPVPATYAYFDSNLVAQVDVDAALAGGPPSEDEAAVMELLRVADRFRGELPPMEALLRALDESGASLGWRELSAITQRLGREWAGVLPPFALDFLAAYLQERKAEWVVDPAVSNPALLAAAVDAGAVDRAVGLVPDSSLLPLAEAVRTEPAISWTSEDLLLTTGKARAALGRPNLIISAPPFGLKGSQGPVVLSDGRALDVRDDRAHRLLLQTAAELAEDGEAIFLVADSFFRSGAGRVRSLLGEVGLYVHAVISVRQGPPGVNVAASLVFIRGEPSETVFVAELSPSIDRDQLLSQMQRRRRGPVPALGRLVPWEGFEGYAEVAKTERADAMLAEAPGEPVPLTDILGADVVRPRKGEDFEFAPNAVYLPTFAASPVHASRGDLTSKPWGYFQLPLRPDRALAEYVAGLLNSPAGRALRESIAGGAIHPSISRRALDELQLPLPAIEVQREAVELQARIRALRLELGGLERQLTADPGSAESVAVALAELGERDPLTSFREALPFPLASILWRYEADADLEDKAGHLFRFFEASAIFFATVLLSGFLRENELYRRERKQWFKKLRRNSFDRTSFGTWTLFGHKMASSARAMLADENDGPRMLTAYAVGSERFAETVASEELWVLLDEAKSARNEEKGHGGIVGPAQHETTHTRLAGLLTKLGELLGPCLGDVILVRPGAGRKRRGVVHYDKAELLQGPQGIFRQVSVTTSESGGLEDSELYLLSSSENPAPTALRLEPFVRLKHSPQDAQNACYFYAKVDGSEVEFVSHHFEGRPRITEPDAEVVELIAALQAPDNGNGS